MATIELTLDAGYCHRWGVWEGIREILQNGIDGERQLGCPLSVHVTKSGTLIVENTGAEIPREAILIGFSTKRDDPNLSGQFGEGLKLGVLALVRSGYEVVIRNRREVWKPVIEKSEKFNSANVLKFKITKGQKDYMGLRVEVKGIDREIWEKELEPRFLFLKAPEKSIETMFGTILLDPKLCGHVFVKGIYVDHDAELEYGFDFPEAELDRDRRMIRSWDLRYKTARVVMEASRKQPELFSSVFDLMEKGTSDVENMGYVADENTEFVEKAAEAFIAKYGENSVPVSDLGESREIDHLGRRGIIVSKPLRKVLEHKFGDHYNVRKKLSESSFEVLTYSDLNDEEKSNLELAVEMIRLVDTRLEISFIQIVEYADIQMLGQWTDQHIRIARKSLDTLESALRVLAHEWCHGAGGDGEKVFTDSVETLLAKVAVASLKA